MANSLWMGDIDKWMDENFIYSLFAHTGELVNVKIVRDKANGQASGYGFIYFNSPTAAQYVMENYNGQPIPNTNKVFRLNWAAYGVNAQKRNEAQAVFVGDLAPDVNEYFLLQTFQYYYPSVYSAKVITDPHTGMSKGYGFVYFGDDTERNRSLTEMQGFYLSYRPIKVNLASKKNMPVMPIQAPSMIPSTTANVPFVDPTNTTVFVGGIDPSVTHDILRSAFHPFGEIVGIKIPHGKGCGFIEFATHEQAAQVLKELNGAAIIGNSQVRLSWGRPGNSARSPTHPESVQIYSSSSSTNNNVTSTSTNTKTEININNPPSKSSFTNPISPTELRVSEKGNSSSSSKTNSTTENEETKKTQGKGVKREKEDDEEEEEKEDQPSKRTKVNEEEEKEEKKKN